MAKYESLRGLFTAIADAIRAKTGSTGAIVAEDFPEFIEGIEPVIEPLTITENGTYTAPDGVDGYSPITVSVVPTKSDLDALIDGSLTEITSNAESVKSWAFCNHHTITHFNFPKATRICKSAFYDTTTGGVNYTGNFPKVTHIESYAFAAGTTGSNQHLLEVANFPEVVTIDGYAFYKNIHLKQIYFPKVETIGDYAFGTNQGAMQLETVDLPKVTSIGDNEFKMCVKLTKLILRSETICAAKGRNVLYRCYHFHGTVDSTYNPSGLKDGYIYVPSSLIEAYKTATNWVTFADQFRALEDYTVDGTITGELDESKVGL